MKKLRLVILLVAALWWAWVSYRALSVTTGKLGPVTVTWSNLGEPTSFARFAQAQTEAATTNGDLRLAPNEAVQFLVTVPNQSRFFRATIIGSAELSLDDEHRDPTKRQAAPSQTRLFDRFAIIALRGQYRLTIRNHGSVTAKLDRVQLIWQP